MYPDMKCRSYQNKIRSQIQNQSKRKVINTNNIKSNILEDKLRLASDLINKRKWALKIESHGHTISLNQVSINYSHL